MFQYFVHNYSDNIDENNRNNYNKSNGSEVTVCVYSGGKSRIFKQPYLKGNLWHVFDMDGDTIIPVNFISIVHAASNIGE